MHRDLWGTDSPWEGRSWLGPGGAHSGSALCGPSSALQFWKAVSCNREVDVPTMPFRREGASVSLPGDRVHRWLSTQARRARATSRQEDPLAPFPSRAPSPPLPGPPQPAPAMAPGHCHHKQGPRPGSWDKWSFVFCKYFRTGCRGGGLRWAPPNRSGLAAGAPAGWGREVFPLGLLRPAPPQRTVPEVSKVISPLQRPGPAVEMEPTGDGLRLLRSWSPGLMAKGCPPWGCPPCWPSLPPRLRPPGPVP